MKKIISYITLLIIVGLPITVNATNQNSSVYSGSNINTCTSNYQDRSLLTDSSVYFNHCMQITCSGNQYTMDNLRYYSSDTVTCSNGNSAPYYEVINNSACKKITTQTCNNDTIQYCSLIMYYDCGRTQSGASYTTTTKTTTTTRRRTYAPTTTTTTTQTTEPITKASKFYLQSLTISPGTIEFSKEKFDYNIEVETSVKNITVNAIPEDTRCNVNVVGNSNITNDSVINITVNCSENKSEYKINVTKKESTKLSSNANLKSLIITDYKFDFNSKINDYTVIIDPEVTELDINYTLEDEKSIATISGNSDIKNGSKVTIDVTAEDGTIKTYTINIVVKTKSNFLKILFIIILVLAILAGAYYLYKKLILNKKGEKYEYE